MKINKFLLRFYPPAVIVEYSLETLETGQITLDLCELNEITDPGEQSQQLLKENPLLPKSCVDNLKQLINCLKEKLKINVDLKFKKHKQIKAHVQPLTNCCFNKYGTQFITGSYDRTCKIWDADTGTC